jgi:A/G-specific adenine glycosylase
VARALLAWFAVQARDLPWRRTLDPYAIWVSEIMLQQTQVRTVTAYWERWMRALPDVRALAAAPEPQLLKLWEGLGYYRRVRHLQAAAREIVERHGGAFPTGFDDVLALPGIGRYTAGAICSIAFNQPRPLLDGNVTRVLTRLSGIRTDPRSAVNQARLWEQATEIVAAAAHEPAPAMPGRPALCLAGPCSAVNQALMELGALICTPAAPRCADCPLRGRCEAQRRGLTASIPAARARPATQARRLAAFVCEKRGRVLVRQRPASSVNGGFWEFPFLERADGEPVSNQEAARALGAKVASLHPLGEVRHAIMQSRYAIGVHRAELDATPRACERLGRWLGVDELRRLPLTGASLKILRCYLDADGR